MIDLVRTVNFGSRKKNLSTIGYTIKNYSGGTVEARKTDGVVELVDGIYTANISFPDNFQGVLIWDTGDATILYATEDIDTREVTYNGPYYGNMGNVTVKGVFTEAEKERLFELLADIMRYLRTLNTNDVLEAIKNIKVPELPKLALESNNSNIDMIKQNSSKIVKAVEGLAEAIGLIMDAKHIDNIIEEVKGHE